MNKINWKVRLSNRQWWLYMIPALLVLIKMIAKTFGFEFDISFLSENIQAVIEAAFMVLGLMGIVNDPTTKGIGDSENALTYTEPK